jgi:hypothetical protein
MISQLYRSRVVTPGEVFPSGQTVLEDAMIDRHGADSYD